MRTALVTIIVVVSVLLGVKAAKAWSIEEMNAQIEATNYLVNDGCSGTLIDIEKRLILTAEHCIRQQYRLVERERVKDDGTVVKEKIRRVLPGQVRQFKYAGALETHSTAYRTKVVLADKETDLALLQILAPIPNKEAARLSCVEPKRGETTYTVGNPYGDLYSSVNRGNVASVQRTYAMIGIDEQGDNALMQVSPGFIGGNSGGAVYDGTGKLIGVPVRGNPAVGLAAPLADIKKLLMREGLNKLWAHCEEPAKSAEE